MNEELRLSTATIIDKSTNEYKLEIRNNNGKIEYYIDGVLVPQTDFDNNTWKPKTK